MIRIGAGHALDWVRLRSRNPLCRYSSHVLLVVTGGFSCLGSSVISIATCSCQIINALLAGVLWFCLTKSYALKDDESIGYSGEAYKNDNGNQSCIVFENALFLSRSKIIFHAVTVGINMMELTETISPRPNVKRTGSPLEWLQRVLYVTIVVIFHLQIIFLTPLLMLLQT